MLSSRLAALERSLQQDLGIDPFMSDLQTNGHRQLLLIDEAERVLILQSCVQAQHRPTHAVHISYLLVLSKE